MAGTAIDMSKVKQLLQLKQSGMSNRQIAKTLGISRDKANEFVLSWMSRLDIDDVYIITFAPFLERFGDELRSIVASYVLWLSVKPDNLFK